MDQRGLVVQEWGILGQGDMGRPGFAHCSGNIKPQNGTASISSMEILVALGKFWKMPLASGNKRDVSWGLELCLGRRVRLATCPYPRLTLLSGWR